MRSSQESKQGKPDGDLAAMLSAQGLTNGDTAHTLAVVFRAVATAVVCAMLSTSWSAAFQHVHADAGHEHAEHQHGLAAHVHAVPAPVAADHDAGHTDHPDPVAPPLGARLEGCDPGTHAVSVTFTAVAPQPEHPLIAVTVDAATLAPPEYAWCRLAASHARAHSPPRLTDAPLRAPPVVYLA